MLLSNQSSVSMEFNDYAHVQWGRNGEDIAGSGGTDTRTGSTNTGSGCNYESNDNSFPHELDILESLSVIVSKHPSGIKELFGKKSHYKILNGETNEEILSGTQLNGWNCRKPITIYNYDDDEVLRIEFHSEGFLRQFLPPQRATVYVLPGRPIGIIKTKSNFFRTDFEVYDESGALHFIIKSQEKVFKASEYPIIVPSDGSEVGRILRSGTKLTLNTASQLSPLVKAVFIGLMALLDCIVRESAGTGT